MAPGTVPVTVITGFFGAGKTTLLNHILKSPEHGMRFAVIENEFGEVGVDEKVIVESPGEEIIEPLNGCICCTVRGDLVGSLLNLHAKVAKFDGVIIETTGLADPSPVAQTFFVDDGVKSKYRLDGFIAVVDAKHVLQHLDEALEQVAFSDRILLNKTDLVLDEAELEGIEARIRSVNSQAPIIRCQHGVVNPGHLLRLRAFDLERVLHMDPQTLEWLDTSGDLSGDVDLCDDLSVSSCSCRFQGELNVNKLQDWISEIIRSMGAGLLRYKGVLAVKGMRQKFAFQGVHMLFAGCFSHAEWGWNEERECRFVFIGQNLDREALLQGILHCLVEGELRFKVGDRVEANVGTWTPGVIVKIWDEGNPYRIELTDEERSHVWGPQDDDNWVRAPRPVGP